MANEFKHLDAGEELTRTEDNAVGRHIADGQTANDMLYFNGTYWIRATVATIKGILNWAADIATHAALTVAGTHGSTTAATANKIVHRDASGRAKVVAPSAESDVALKSNVTTVNSALTTHGALTTAHGAVSAATASKMVVRDAQGQAKFAAPAEAGDTLVKGTRVTTAELPALTDEKIWKGTGGNVEEVDMPSGLTFTELVGGENYTSAGGYTWEDWDLSAIIGAGAKAVLITIAVSSTATYRGVRKNGSALNRLIYCLADDNEKPILCECDANRVVEVNGPSANTQFCVLGYWS